MDNNIYRPGDATAKPHTGYANQYGFETRERESPLAPGSPGNWERQCGARTSALVHQSFLAAEVKEEDASIRAHNDSLEKEDRKE